MRPFRTRSCLLAGVLCAAAAFGPRLTAEELTSGQKDSAGDLTVYVPIPLVPSGPFGVHSLFGYYAPMRAFPQPIGHRIIPKGANGYVYQPVYQHDLESAAERLLPAETAAEATTAAVADSADEWLGLALDAFHAGEYEQCARLCGEWVESEGADGLAELLQAQAWFAAGNYNLASAALRRAMGLLSAWELGRFVEYYRDYYGQAADFARQWRALERHVLRRPDQAGARLFLGFLYGFRGYLGEAIDELRAAVRLLPEDEDALRLLEHFEDARRRAERLRAEEEASPRRGGPREF